MTLHPYSDDAVSRSREEALDWLRGNGDGFPRSWTQEQADTQRRGYEIYEPDFEAPPIAGYEALEAEGLATRLGAVQKAWQERIHFQLAQAQ